MIVYKGQGIDWHPQSDSLGVSPLKWTRSTPTLVSSSMPSSGKPKAIDLLYWLFQKAWPQHQPTQPVHPPPLEHLHHRYFQACKLHSSVQHHTTPQANTTPTPPVSAIEAYIQTLKTQGKDKAEVLQTLKLCYKDPPENIASIELEDF